MERRRRAFAFRDTFCEGLYIERSHFPQSGQVDLRVGTCGSHRHVPKVASNLLKCQTLGQQAGRASMPKSMWAKTLGMKPKLFLVFSHHAAQCGGCDWA